ncbi:hypothetical protein [Streptomyces purpureus]|uniref:Uncharacterized protein n=1 Tax=Streptomyces purpureus TaxID=1951 RepID=A0A918LWA1_9ACTN|nr:hypothetical protein [Streptomyces purpureus]GGT59192.1 hypothetical protein GCM10014713_60810 [Streptomyces purpureus]
MEFSRFIPLPNSPAWDLLVDYDRPSFFRSSDDIDAYLAGLDITITPEKRRAVRPLRRGGPARHRGTRRRAENFTHVTEEYALSRIADVGELVTAHNVRTGNNVG